MKTKPNQQSNKTLNTALTKKTSALADVAGSWNLTGLAQIKEYLRDSKETGKKGIKNSASSLEIN